MEKLAARGIEGEGWAAVTAGSASEGPLPGGCSDWEADMLAETVFRGDAFVLLCAWSFFARSFEVRVDAKVWNRAELHTCLFSVLEDGLHEPRIGLSRLLLASAPQVKARMCHRSVLV